MDLATILLLQKSSFVVGACGFAYVRWQSPNTAGLGALAFGYLLLSVASTIAGLGEERQIPYELWTLLSFSVGVIGYASLWVGVKRISSGSKMAGDWLALALPAAWIIAALETGFHLDSIRGIVFNANAVLFLGAAAIQVVRDGKREALFARYPLAASLAVSSALSWGVLLGMIGFTAVPIDISLCFFLLIMGNFALALFVLILVKERAEHHLLHLLETDVLTGIPNRRSFYLKLPQHLARGDCLILLDIDHFKKVNDEYGHDGGDVALKAVAQEIARSLQPGETLARLGGEEFGIFLRDQTESLAEATAERIRVAVRMLRVQHGDRGIPLSISAGVAVFSGTESVEELMRQADQALYAAKSLGRNRVSVAGTISYQNAS